MQLSTRAKAVQTADLGKAAHLDGELDGRAGAADARVCRRADDGDDLQVEVG